MPDTTASITSVPSELASVPVVGRHHLIRNHVIYRRATLVYWTMRSWALSAALSKSRSQQVAAEQTVDELKRLRVLSWAKQAGVSEFLVTLLEMARFDKQLKQSLAWWKLVALQEKLRPEGISRSKALGLVSGKRMQVAVWVWRHAVGRSHGCVRVTSTVEKMQKQKSAFLAYHVIIIWRAKLSASAQADALAQQAALAIESVLSEQQTVAAQLRFRHRGDVRGLLEVHACLEGNFLLILVWWRWSWLWRWRRQCLVRRAHKQTLISTRILWIVLEVWLFFSVQAVRWRYVLKLLDRCGDKQNSHIAALCLRAWSHGLRRRHLRFNILQTAADRRFWHCRFLSVPRVCFDAFRQNRRPRQFRVARSLTKYVFNPRDLVRVLYAFERWQNQISHTKAAGESNLTKVELAKTLRVAEENGSCMRRCRGALADSRVDSALACATACCFHCWHLSTSSSRALEVERALSRKTATLAAEACVPNLVGKIDRLLTGLAWNCWANVCSSCKFRRKHFPGSVKRWSREIDEALLRMCFSSWRCKFRRKHFPGSVKRWSREIDEALLRMCFSSWLTALSLESAERKLENVQNALVEAKRECQDIRDVAERSCQDAQLYASRKCEEAQDAAERMCQDVRDATEQKCKDVMDSAGQTIQDLQDSADRKFQSLQNSYAAAISVAFRRFANRKHRTPSGLERFVPTEGGISDPAALFVSVQLSGSPDPTAITTLSTAMESRVSFFCDLLCGTFDRLYLVRIIWACLSGWATVTRRETLTRLENDFSERANSTEDELRMECMRLRNVCDRRTRALSSAFVIMQGSREVVLVSSLLNGWAADVRVRRTQIDSSKQRVRYQRFYDVLDVFRNFGILSESFSHWAIVYGRDRCACLLAAAVRSEDLIYRLEERWAKSEAVMETLACLKAWRVITASIQCARGIQQLSANHHHDTVKLLVSRATERSEESVWTTLVVGFQGWKVVSLRTKSILELDKISSKSTRLYSTVSDLWKNELETGLMFMCISFWRRIATSGLRARVWLHCWHWRVAANNAETRVWSGVTRSLRIWGREQLISAVQSAWYSWRNVIAESRETNLRWQCASEVIGRWQAWEAGWDLQRRRSDIAFVVASLQVILSCWKRTVFRRNPTPEYPIGILICWLAWKICVSASRLVKAADLQRDLSDARSEAAVLALESAEDAVQKAKDEAAVATRLVREEASTLVLQASEEAAATVERMTVDAERAMENVSTRLEAAEFKAMKDAETVNAHAAEEIELMKTESAEALKRVQMDVAERISRTEQTSAETFARAEVSYALRMQQAREENLLQVRQAKHILLLRTDMALCAAHQLLLLLTFMNAWHSLLVDVHHVAVNAKSEILKQRRRESTANFFQRWLTAELCRHLRQVSVVWCAFSAHRLACRQRAATSIGSASTRRRLFGCFVAWRAALASSAAELKAFQIERANHRFIHGCAGVAEIIRESRQERSCILEWRRTAIQQAFLRRVARFKNCHSDCVRYVSNLATGCILASAHRRWFTAMIVKRSRESIVQAAERFGFRPLMLAVSRIMLVWWAEVLACGHARAQEKSRRLQFARAQALVRCWVEMPTLLILGHFCFREWVRVVETDVLSRLAQEFHSWGSRNAAQACRWRGEAKTQDLEVQAFFSWASTVRRNAPLRSILGAESRLRRVRQILLRECWSLLAEYLARWTCIMAKVATRTALLANVELTWCAQSQLLMRIAMMRWSNLPVRQKETNALATARRDKCLGACEKLLVWRTVLLESALRALLCFASWRRVAGLARVSEGEIDGLRIRCLTMRIVEAMAKSVDVARGPAICASVWQVWSLFVQSSRNFKMEQFAATLDTRREFVFLSALLVWDQDSWRSALGAALWAWHIESIRSAHDGVTDKLRAEICILERGGRLERSRILDELLKLTSKFSLRAQRHRLAVCFVLWRQDSMSVSAVRAMRGSDMIGNSELARYTEAGSRALVLGASLGRRALLTAARERIARASDALAAASNPGVLSEGFVRGSKLARAGSHSLAAHVSFLVWRSLGEVLRGHVSASRQNHRERWRDRVLNLLVPVVRASQAACLHAVVAAWYSSANYERYRTRGAYRRLCLSAARCARLMEISVRLHFLSWALLVASKLSNHRFDRLANVLREIDGSSVAFLHLAHRGWYLEVLQRRRAKLEKGVVLMVPLLEQTSDTVEKLQLRLLSVRIYGPCRRRILEAWRGHTIGYFGRRPQALSEASSRAGSGSPARRSPCRRPVISVAHLSSVATPCGSPSRSRNKPSFEDSDIRRPAMGPEAASSSKFGAKSSGFNAPKQQDSAQPPDANRSAASSRANSPSRMLVAATVQPLRLPVHARAPVAGSRIVAASPMARTREAVENPSNVSVITTLSRARALQASALIQRSAMDDAEEFYRHAAGRRDASAHKLSLTVNRLAPPPEPSVPSALPTFRPS